MPTKRYFVISDIHSFYTEMKQALWDAGFRKTNPQHYLIVCGDIFDRGPDTMGVYQFLISIPKKRRIMIKGNHEYLYEELMEKDLPDRYDFSNGTVKSFYHIAGYDNEQTENIIREFRNDMRTSTQEDNKWWYKQWRNIVEKVAASPITKWLNSKEWQKHYYEVDKYIFVHSFIPTQLQKKYEMYKNAPWFFPNYPPEYCEYNPQWRTELDWYGAVCGNPWLQYREGLIQPENEQGKTLVCGHWHAYDFRISLDGVTYATQEDIDFGIYYSKDIIAIDACTAVSGQCNVLVFDSAE